MQTSLVEMLLNIRVNIFPTLITWPNLKKKMVLVKVLVEVLVEIRTVIYISADLLSTPRDIRDLRQCED